MDDPADLLRQRGLQVTAQRLAVLKAVSAAPHITADAVAEAVRAQIGSISLQAVYDALGVLVAEGLLRRIQRQPSSLWCGRLPFAESDPCGFHYTAFSNSLSSQSGAPGRFPPEAPYFHSLG